MSSRSKLLINGFGDYLEHKNPKVVQESSDNLFFWKQVIFKEEIAKLKQERKIFKVSSLKSGQTKLEYKTWLHYFFPLKKKVTLTVLKKSLKAIRSNQIKLVVKESKLDEKIVNTEFFEKRLKFQTQTNYLLEEIKRNCYQIANYKTSKRISWQNTENKGDSSSKIANHQAKIANLKAQIEKEISDFNQIKLAQKTEKESEPETIAKNAKIEVQYKQALQEIKVKMEKAKFNLPASIRYKYPLNTLHKRVQKSQKTIKILAKLQNRSWNYNLAYNYALNDLENGETILKLVKQTGIDFQKHQKKLSSLETTNSTLTSEIKQKIKACKQEAKKEWNQICRDLKTARASKHAFQSRYEQISNRLKMKIAEIKLENPKKLAQTNYKDFKYQQLQKIGYLWNLYNSNRFDIRKKTPVEITKKQFWTSTFLGLLVPGSSGLINRQWVKGSVQLFFTAICILLAAYSLGAFPSSKGNGVIGLGTLGADGQELGYTGGELNDGRFFLVMGALSIILLVVILFYWLVSALNTINQNNLARIGVRHSTWKEQKQLLKTSGLPYLLSTPAIIFVLFIIVLPILATVMISFTDIFQKEYLPDRQIITHNGFGYPIKWVGWEQFKYITVTVSEDFWKVFSWTIIWTFGATLLTLFIGTGLALIVNQNRIKGKAIIRLIYILPWAIPAFLSILFFSLFFNASGTFNSTLGFGIDWKNEVGYEKTLLIFLQAWLGQSYIFILITGIIQSIPKSLYEASRMDGASTWRRFRTITGPMVLLQVAPLLISQFTMNFNNFNIIFLFNKGGPNRGGTAGSTDIFMSWIYNFVSNSVDPKPGAAAAMSLIVAVIIVTPTAYLFFRSKSFRQGRF